MADIEATIADLLLMSLGTLPAQTPPVDIAWPGIGYAPVSGKTYLEPQIIPNANINRGVANDSATEFRGVFQVAVMAPSNAGIVVPHRVAGAVADHFERGATIHGAGVIVHIEGRPSVAPYLQEPDRIRVPVSIRYYTFA